jgi:hypothetical protein
MARGRVCAVRKLPSVNAIWLDTGVTIKPTKLRGLRRVAGIEGDLEVLLSRQFANCLLDR